MIVHVINLDRSPDRLLRFQETNAHLSEVGRFAAVDGQAQDVSALIRSNIIDATILDRYTPGALGNALSHLTLWAKAAVGDAVMTVAEDDAVFHHDFEAQAASLLARLPADWDIVLWGWNFDSAMLAELIPGVASGMIFGDEAALNRNIAAFQRQVLDPRLLRLSLAFGALCYSVSPKGARALRDFCLPIRDMRLDLPWPEPGHKTTLQTRGWVRNRATSIMMSIAYPSLQAFVSLPPLVVSQNERANSTVQIGGPLLDR